MFTNTKIITAAILAAAAFGCSGVNAQSFTNAYELPPAVAYVSPQALQPTAYPTATPVLPAPAPVYSAQDLDQMTAAIALYPDPLLADLLPAVTYPADLAAAEQWMQATPQITEAGIAQQPWDDSVKALVHYPTVMALLQANPDWAQALGTAMINQPQDVMDSIQRLRAQAQADGSLQNTQQQQVVVQDGEVEILPADGQTLCVPVYDPTVVYEQEAPVEFVASPIGVWLNFGFDWGHHHVTRGNDWMHQGRDHRVAVPARLSVTTWVRDSGKAGPVVAKRPVGTVGAVAGRPAAGALPGRPLTGLGGVVRQRRPVTAGHAAPAPAPGSATKTAGRPILAPIPHPAPAPAPRPVPSPRPIPAPAPHPTPVAHPAPAPAARAIPTPAPRPAPAPAPRPAPVVTPQPAARPVYTPAPRATPEPAARPAPVERSEPAPRPAPVERAAPAPAPRAAPAAANAPAAARAKR